MTRDRLDDGDVATAEAFEDVLAEAIERAIKNGVDVRGAWEFRTQGSTHDWEVEIVELDKEFDEED